MTTTAKGSTATSKEAASAGTSSGGPVGSGPAGESPTAAPPRASAPHGPHRPPAGFRHRLRQGARRVSGRAYWTTPRLVRALTALSLAALVGLGATAAGVLGGARDGTDTIGHGAAPQATRAADLYFALSDMDAQAANLLLIGADPDYTALHRTTLDTYEQRRAQADDDLQEAARAAGDDPASQRAVQRVFGELGSYEALVARAQLLEDQAGAPAGKPSEEALAAYRQATDLLRQQLLPAADQVTSVNEAVVDRVYRQQRSDLSSGWWELALVGLFALAVLLVLQRTLTVRYRRLVNPALAAVTLLTAAVLATGLHLVSTADDNLVTAKSNAYDSVIALSRARAVAFDMNADESRYLTDPVLAATYERTYLEKSQSIVRLSGVTVGDYSGRLETAAAQHLADRSVPFGGYLGTELNNITFPGERDAAERVLTAFRSYQQVDHKIRALRDAGRLKDAVTLNTGLSKGQSNYEFDQLSKAMGDTIDVNTHAMDTAVADTDDALDGTTAAVAGLVLAVALVLVAVGVRPRLHEYR